MLKFSLCLQIIFFIEHYSPNLPICNNLILTKTIIRMPLVVEFAELELHIFLLISNSKYFELIFSRNINAPTSIMSSDYDFWIYLCIENSWCREFPFLNIEDNGLMNTQLFSKMNCWCILNNPIISLSWKIREAWHCCCVICCSWLFSLVVK